AAALSRGRRADPQPCPAPRLNLRSGLHNPVTLPYRLGPRWGSPGKETRNAVNVSPSGFPALVLNADFRPLSYYPLSLWAWQDAIKAVFLDRVNIVAGHDRAGRTPSLEMKYTGGVS